MILGRVMGTVVATIKLKILEGHKIMLVQPIDAQENPVGRVVLALDMVQAGVGDKVLVLDEGNSARLILGDPMAPVRTVIVGIIDAINREESL
ncbi:Carbon dioxide concentrating mechanism protein CcmL [subsurface metagenome]